MRIKTKNQLATNDFVLNEYFHKLMSLKSMQDIRNKDFVKETIPKIKGDITHERG